METRRMNRKEAYGLVKQAVIEGHAAGMTYAEAVAKYGVRKQSLYSAAKRLGLSLKPSKHIK
jgi:hypothetical protein